MQPSGHVSGAEIRVVLELEGGDRWTPASLELVSDAFAVAERWKGQVAGWLFSAPENAAADPAPLAACGCRRVEQVVHPRLARWSSEAMVAALVARLDPHCRAIVIPGVARGEELAALVAGRLRTSWTPDALTLAVDRTGGLEITAVQPGGKLARTFRPVDSTPAVITMRPGVAEIRSDRKGTCEWVVSPAELDDVPELTAVEEIVAADPRTVDLTQADRIVSAGRGADGPAGVALVAELADELGAALGASRVAVDLGWVPVNRQVGQTGRTVQPELYVACGISGASHHVVGMRQSKHIVAINPEAKAPIHEVAHLSLRGDLREVIPPLLAALRQRATAASPAP